jgi:hypothetical protein
MRPISRVHRRQRSVTLVHVLEVAGEVVPPAPIQDRSVGSRAPDDPGVSADQRAIPFLDLGYVGVAFRVQTRSAPERDDAGERDGGSEVGGELVVARGDAAEVLQSAERRLDTPAIFVAGQVVLDRLPACAPARDDRGGAAALRLSRSGSAS